MKNLKLIFVLVVSVGAYSCGNARDYDEIAKEGKDAIDAMESEYSADGDLLKEVPNTDVSVQFSGFSNKNFSKVYRYQANVSDTSTFIWVVMDNNDMDDKHLAVTLDLGAISGEGEFTLDRQRNGNIYVEIDGMSFRSDAGNASVTITSATGEFLEGTFSGVDLLRTQNAGDEKISIDAASFKLPLNDMRRK